MCISESTLCVTGFLCAHFGSSALKVLRVCIFAQCLTLFGRCYLASVTVSLHTLVHWRVGEVSTTPGLSLCGLIYLATKSSGEKGWNCLCILVFTVARCCLTVALVSAFHSISCVFSSINLLWRSFHFSWWIGFDYTVFFTAKTRK